MPRRTPLRCRIPNPRDSVILLPLFPAMTDNEHRYIIEQLRGLARGSKP